jgi:hypothetical protein
MIRFPVYENHSEVKCFHCRMDLGKEERAISDNYSGVYYKQCPECGFNTYYDIKSEGNNARV